MNPLFLIVIVLVCLALFGGVGWNNGWHSSYPQAYYGGGGVGLILVVVVIILLLR